MSWELAIAFKAFYLNKVASEHMDNDEDARSKTEGSP
jgi:hypothetical protein